MKKFKKHLKYYLGDASNVLALDLSNQGLRDALFEKLHYDTEIIGFFLALEVFPTETQQSMKAFSSRLL